MFYSVQNLIRSKQRISGVDYLISFAFLCVKKFFNNGLDKISELC